MFDQFQDPWFKEKYMNVPSIFNEWISPFIDFPESVILDFGCGDGVISLGIATHFSPKKIISVDTQYLYKKLKAAAMVQIGMESLPENLEFKHILPGKKIADQIQCNCIFSWSVFEHIDKYLFNGIIEDLRDTLLPGGFFFLQIQPLYYSPTGSHLNDIITRPWAHLIEQENHLLAAIDNAKRRVSDRNDMDFSEDYDFIAYKHLVWRCYQTLNKLTGDDIIERFEAHGFDKIREYRTECKETPPPELTRIYNEKILKNDQIVLLFQKK